MNKITVELNKKTIQSAYGEMKLLRMIGSAYADSDSPMIKLLKESKLGKVYVATEDIEILNEVKKKWRTSNYYK